MQFNALSQELSTIRDYLNWGTRQFEEANLCFGHGTDNAWDEAVALLTFACHLPADCNADVLDNTLTVVERMAVLNYFAKRIETRKPAAYLTERAYFMRMPYYVNESVLVPRSPIAELIAEGFSPWITQAPERILDLCTGSGCIGIACAHVFPDAQVVASDISEQALAVAKRNVAEHKVNVALYSSDLFSQIPQQTFDIIVSNPPYVSDLEINSLPAEYHAEPVLGLRGGDQDGLALVQKILLQAGQYLADEGILIVEVGNSAEALVDRYPGIPFTWLEFEQGGDGVFLLTASELQAAIPVIDGHASTKKQTSDSE